MRCRFGLGLELFHDGEYGGTNFEVVVGQGQVRVHFAVVGVGEFSTGFWTVFVHRAGVVITEKGAGRLLQAV